MSLHASSREEEPDMNVAALTERAADHDARNRPVEVGLSVFVRRDPRALPGGGAARPVRAGGAPHAQGVGPRDPSARPWSLAAAQPEEPERQRSRLVSRRRPLALARLETPWDAPDEPTLEPSVVPVIVSA